MNGNGFASHGLDEDAFGEKKSSLVQSFDAFRKYIENDALAIRH